MATKAAPFRITGATIAALGGCGYGIGEFDRKFPKGLTMTQAINAINKGTVIVAGNGPGWLLGRIGLAVNKKDWWRFDKKLTPELSAAKKKELAKLKKKQDVLKKKEKALIAQRRVLRKEEDRIYRHYESARVKLQKAAAKAYNSKGKSALTEAKLETAIKNATALRRLSTYYSYDYDGF